MASLGQGFKGGKAAVANLFGGNGLPQLPKGVKVAAKPSAQPLLPLQPPLASPPPPQIVSDKGGALDLRAPGQASEPGQYAFDAYMRRGMPKLPGSDMSLVDHKALLAIHHPASLSHLDQATKLTILNPQGELKQVIQADPETQSLHHAAVVHLAKDAGLSTDGTSPPSAPPTSPLSGQGALEQMGARLMAQAPPKTYIATSPEDTKLLQQYAKAGVLDPFGGNLPKHLLTEGSQMLLGLGPGLVHTGIGLATDPTGTVERIGKGLAHSYGETIHHPGRQLNQDPLGFLMNATTPLFLGAGATARGAELQRLAGVKVLPKLGKVVKMGDTTPPSVEDLARSPMKARFPVAEMPNGEVRVGAPGEDHSTLLTPEEEKTYTDLYNAGGIKAVDQFFDSIKQGTGIFDPETGKIAVVNSHTGAHQVADEGLPSENKMLQAARVAYGEVKNPRRPTLTGTLTPKAVAKTLLRPQPQERSVSLKLGGETQTPHITVTPEAMKLLDNPQIDRLFHEFDMREPKEPDYHPNANLDHYEDLHAHLGRAATPEDPLKMFTQDESGNYTRTPVQNPQAFASRLGGVFEYLKSIAQSPKELNSLEKLQDQVYRSLDTSITPEEFRRLSGPPQTMVAQVLDLVDEALGQPGVRGVPKVPEETIGREDPASVWSDIQNRLDSSERTPFTLHPPAYKSALGGYLQTKVLDPLLEKHIAEPTPYARAGAAFTKFMNAGKPGKITAAAQFGRKARTDLENDIRIRTGGLVSRVGTEEEAANIARGTAFADRWRALHGAGVTAEEAAQQPWRDWTAIKPPPADMPTKRPELLTPRDFKNHPYLKLSNGQLADQFEKGSRMIPTHRAEEAMLKSEEPQDVRYVPSDLINGMKTYKPDVGKAAGALNAIDRGTQLIRSGRFMTPAYAQWAVQNGLIDLSQQGAFMFRNIWQLKKEFPKLPRDVQGMIDHGMGKGIAMATSGGESAAKMRFLNGPKIAALQHFWHKLDDQWARRLAAIHELNSSGFHSASAWTKLARKDPEKFRQIVGGQANREAINYTEMSPSERATLQKLMTAYGWIRGASTYAARFPLQHPVQARVGSEIGQEGEKYVDEYYKKLGGMVPSWLREYLPLGGSRLLQTQWASPTGTLGNLIGEAPGATIGQTEALTGELAPVPTALMEMASGTSKYGTPYKGTQRFTAPISQAISRFKPLSALETFGQFKKGGTFHQGRLQGLEQLAGSPMETLRNPTQTAGLGEKDYEASLPTPDKIQFQYSQSINNLPAEVAEYKRVTGNDLAPSVLSRIKTDLDNVEQRDLFQYHYAQAHHAKTWKSLPPLNKLNGTVEWLTDHGFSSAELTAIHHAAARLTNDKEVDTLVNSLWAGTGIGAASGAWKRAQKGFKPPVLTGANG